MKKTLFAVVFTVGLFTLAPRALAGEKAKEAGAGVLVPADDLKWLDVPGRDGVKTAVVEGDPAKGPHHAFLKLTPGFAVPLHHHTANHYVTVLAGTMVFAVDGKDIRLPAGSYFSFVGKKPHTTRCEEGAECLIFVDARSMWDVVPEAPRTAAAK